MTSRHEAPAVLVCVECGEESGEGAPGWRAFLTIDDEVALYCAECAAAEFDDHA